MTKSKYLEALHTIAQAWADGEADYVCELEVRYLAEQVKLPMAQVLQACYDERVTIRGW